MNKILDFFLRIQISNILETEMCLGMVTTAVFGIQWINLHPVKTYRLTDLKQAVPIPWLGNCLSEASTAEVVPSSAGL